MGMEQAYFSETICRMTCALPEKEQFSFALPRMIPFSLCKIPFCPRYAKKTRTPFSSKNSGMSSMNRIAPLILFCCERNTSSLQLQNPCVAADQSPGCNALALNDFIAAVWGIGPLLFPMNRIGGLKGPVGRGIDWTDRRRIKQGFEEPFFAVCMPPRRIRYRMHAVIPTRRSQQSHESPCFQRPTAGRLHEPQDFGINTRSPAASLAPPRPEDPIPANAKRPNRISILSPHLRPSRDKGLRLQFSPHLPIALVGSAVSLFFPSWK